MCRYLGISFLLLTVLLLAIPSQAEDQIPVAAPMTTSLIGFTAEVALPSVFRVVVPSTNKAGTAFLHKSGWVITAAHVVEGAKAEDITLLDYKANVYKVTRVLSDPDTDIAILSPEKQISLEALALANDDTLKIGTQITTWGFPGGYYGYRPLLMSGYLSGVDVEVTKSKQQVRRWVINAAFNNGNSGGPVVSIETGEVIGVVSSKLAPLPSDIASALNALKNQKSGFTFTRTFSDGKKDTVSEGQVVESVLEYLRQQTQLVIGLAVTHADLITFLKAQGIDP